ncbi:MAG: hypothetical protein LBL92_01460, partial [Propionibacteriaceae bacterium]|nr:hypothetical protein [Propionibacteriaceae bacterium]
MRKVLLGSLASIVALGAATALIVPQVTAAPGDAATHLGEVLPGSLEDWGGAFEWVSANSAAIEAEGYDTDAVADTTGSETVTVNPATGRITAPAGYSVGYALGDINGDLIMSLGGYDPAGEEVGARLMPLSEDLPLFTLDEVKRLIPPLNMTVMPTLDENGAQIYDTDVPVDYVVDIQAGTIIRTDCDEDPTNDIGAPNANCDHVEYDPIIIENVDLVLSTVWDDMGPDLLAGLTNGVRTALTNEVGFSTEITGVTLPVSFAYPFGDELADGQTATLKMNNIFANSWFAALLDGATGSQGAIEQTAVTDLTLYDMMSMVPEEGDNYTLNTDVSEVVWSALGPELGSMLDSEVSSQGIWLRSAANVRSGVNDGLAEIEGTMPLKEQNEAFANPVSFQQLGRTSTEQIRTQLMTMTDDKVAEWKDKLQLDGPVTLFYEPTGGFNSLVATGLTELETPSFCEVAGPLVPDFMDQLLGVMSGNFGTGDEWRDFSEQMLVLLETPDVPEDAVEPLTRLAPVIAEFGDLVDAGDRTALNAKVSELMMD